MGKLQLYMAFDLLLLECVWMSSAICGRRIYQCTYE